MIRYFRELLQTMQNIAKSLLVIEHILRKTTAKDRDGGLYICTAKFDTNARMGNYEDPTSPSWRD